MICAIVLAAGKSRRMGKPKAMLPFAGSTFAERIVDVFSRAGVDRIFVVLQPNDRELRATLSSRPVEFIENPEVEGDMLSSLRCALRALPGEVHTIAVSPVDQPSLKPELIRELIGAFGKGERILVPVHQGRRGHPLIFAARFREELLSRFDGIGLRGLLQAHPEDVAEWETPDAAVIQDVDTRADYDALTS